MVSLPDIESSNARISTALPPGLVAVFVGGTNGIGETTLKRFAKHARQPRAYFIGRSQEAFLRAANEIGSWLACMLRKPLQRRFANTVGTANEYGNEAWRECSGDTSIGRFDVWERDHCC